MRMSYLILKQFSFNNLSLVQLGIQCNFHNISFISSWCKNRRVSKLYTFTACLKRPYFDNHLQNNLNYIIFVNYYYNNYYTKIYYDVEIKHHLVNIQIWVGI